MHESVQLQYILSFDVMFSNVFIIVYVIVTVGADSAFCSVVYLIEFHKN